MGELALSRNSFLSLDELIALTGRDLGEETRDREKLIAAANASVAFMERHTARKLASRIYRDAFTVPCTLTNASSAVTAVAGLLQVRIGDDVFGAGLPPNARVLAVASDTALTLTVKAETSGPATLTFGTARLAMNGHHERVIHIREYPVTQVFGTPTYINWEGSEVQFDITNARLDGPTGRYALWSQVAPRGVSNVFFDVQAGYRRPSPTDPGDEEWYNLSHLQWRLVDTLFMDLTSQPGRSVTRTIAGETVTYADYKLAADIEMGLAMYRRRW